MTLKVVFKATSSQTNVCLGVFEENHFPLPTASWNKKNKDILEQALKNSTFKGRLNETLMVFSPEGVQVTLIGLGKEKDQSDSQWQKVGSALLSSLEKAPTGKGEVELHSLGKTKDTEVAINLAFGALLKSWHFEKYFTKKKKEELFSAKELIIVTPNPQDAEKAFQSLLKTAEGVFLTRSVVTEPANIMTPEALAKVAASLSQEGLKVEILGEKELKKMGMNALLGVGQGSEQESKLVVMQWEGGVKNEPPLVFVGKGVTFDTGGISIKPAQNMEDMKYDMAGAGVVIGLMKTLALRKAKVNVVGLIGIAENMPSGTAQRPGDVVTSLSGQTVEVINTDAEGRLVLADVLWYAQERFNPKLMVDLATLTGAIIIALGSERAGLFASDERLSKQLMAAGEKVGELLWPLPLDDSYDKDINSDIADMKNVGNGRNAGSIIGAKFLQRFTNKVPWAHLDIAGVTWAQKDLPFCVKGATGFGVRLLNCFVEENYEKSEVLTR